MALEIITVACLEDNYAYLIKGPSGVSLIDAPEAAPIIAALEARGWQLDRIFITHHHWDHVEGLNGLLENYEAQTYGPAAEAEKLPPLDHLVTVGDVIGTGEDACTILDAGGHTLGHIAYYYQQGAALFSADSLMALGCGRIFEGSPKQMHQTLQGFAALPEDTMVYSGHEYTQSNAKFALSVDPDNKALISRAAQINDARADGQPTVPASLKLELATNPFLRAHDSAIRARLGMNDANDLEVFTHIRELKNNF